MRPITVPPERPPRTMSLDALAPYVPSVEAGARALLREAERARGAFRMTDLQHAIHDANKLEQLARVLDVRAMPKTPKEEP